MDVCENTQSWMVRVRHGIFCMFVVTMTGFGPSEGCGGYVEGSRGDLEKEDC
jgi:hypothetical protein